MLKEKIAEDTIKALKEGQAETRSVLGMLKAAIGNKEIEKGKKEEGLSEEEIIEVVMTEAKKIKDSISQFEAAGRKDLLEKEKRELDILARYLPEAISEEEVMASLKEMVAELGLTDKKDFGRAMGEAMKRLKGRADGALVKTKLEELLS